MRLFRSILRKLSPNRTVVNNYYVTHHHWPDPPSTRTRETQPRPSK